MGTAPEPLRVWQAVVPAGWIDYNGHLTEGYYGVAFGAASDEVLTHLGFDEAYREQHGTFYTVETHIRFLLEVHEGSQISTDSYILGADQKRFHMHHDLLVDDDPTPVATQEAMLLHVAHAAAGDTPRAAPMVEPVLGNALALAERHATFPLPDHVGRGVRILH